MCTSEFACYLGSRGRAHDALSCGPEGGPGKVRAVQSLMGDLPPSCCLIRGLYPLGMATLRSIPDTRLSALSSVAASIVRKPLMSGRMLRRKEAEAAVEVSGLRAFERTWDRVKPCLVADACLAGSASNKRFEMVTIVYYDIP